MPKQVKVARRFQVTIPEEVRRKSGISIGDRLVVKNEGEHIVLKKLSDNWEEVMSRTQGAWKNHRAFARFRDSIAVMRWLRGKQ